MKPLENEKREQRALGLAEQAKIGGTTAEPLSLSSSATDKDRVSDFAARRWNSVKIVSDQGCEGPE